MFKSNTGYILIKEQNKGDVYKNKIEVFDASEIGKLEILHSYIIFWIRDERFAILIKDIADVTMFLKRIKNKGDFIELNKNGTTVSLKINEVLVLKHKILSFYEGKDSFLQVDLPNQDAGSDEVTL